MSRNAVGAWGRVRGGSGAVLEAPAVVAGLDDVAMVRQPVEQGRGHLRIAEHAGPFAEGEIGGDDDRRALIEAADQVKQQLAARLREGQVAQLIENDEVQTGEIIGKASLAPGPCFGLEPVDQTGVHATGSTK